MVDNNMNFEEFKAHLMKQYSKFEKHIGFLWLSALKAHANVTNVFEEKKQSEWEKLLKEVKNKSCN